MSQLMHCILLQIVIFQFLSSFTRPIAFAHGNSPDTASHPPDNGVLRIHAVGEKEARKFMAEENKGTVVLVAGTPIGVPGSTNMLRVLQLN